jgi:hypothetical protein
LKNFAWQIIPHEQITEQHWHIWNTLNTHCTQAHPLLDVHFVRPLLAHFGGQETFLAICRYDGDEVAAGFVQQCSPFKWQVLVPGQAPLALFVSRQSHADIDLNNILSSLIRVLPGFVMLLDIIKVDPMVTDIDDIVKSNNILIEKHSLTTSIDLKSSFEDYWSSRKKKIRNRIPQTLRKLEKEKIRYRLVCLSDNDDISQGVEEYGNIESSGWKGRENTAIHIQNTQGQFYVDIMKNFASVNAAKVYVLYFDERAVAALLVIRQAGMWVVLKTTYREEYAQYGPGRLLDYLMIQHAHSVLSTPEVIENYTNASATDTKWATATREIVSLSIFRSALLKRAYGMFRRLRRTTRDT